MCESKSGLQCVCDILFESQICVAADCRSVEWHRSMILFFQLLDWAEAAGKSVTLAPDLFDSLRRLCSCPV